MNFDLSAAKNFAIKERATIQLRLDASDALNHPPMGIPNQTINVNAPSQSSTKITTTGDNRDLQGSLKISFQFASDMGNRRSLHFAELRSR